MLHLLTDLLLCTGLRVKESFMALPRPLLEEDFVLSLLLLVFCWSEYIVELLGRMLQLLSSRSGKSWISKIFSSTLSEWCSLESFAGVAATPLRLTNLGELILTVHSTEFGDGGDTFREADFPEERKLLERDEDVAAVQCISLRFCFTDTDILGTSLRGLALRCCCCCSAVGELEAEDDILCCFSESELGDF